MSSKRYYPWVDYAKCFSILLVISYHCPPRPDGFAGDVLQLLRMPAFFMVAGLLFRQEKYPSFLAFLRHRSRQLLIPYTFFFVVFYVLWLLLGRTISGGDDLLASPLQPLADFVLGTPRLVVATYWFIACLFSMQMIYFLLLRYLPRPAAIAAICLLPAVHSLLPFGLIWNIDLALLYLPYYAAANLLKSRVHSLSRRHLPFVVACLLLSLAGLAFRTSYLIPHTLYLLTDYTTLLCGLCILPAYILFVKALSRLPLDRAAAYIGRNTIIVLALQNYIIGTFKLFLVPATSYLLPTNVCLSFATLLLCIPFIYIINRYMPWTIGRGRFFNAN